MALALLRVEGGQYTGETLDDDLRAYLNDMGHKDLSAFSRVYRTFWDTLHLDIYTPSVV